MEIEKDKNTGASDNKWMQEDGTGYFFGLSFF